MCGEGVKVILNHHPHLCLAIWYVPAHSVKAPGKASLLG